MHVYFKVAQEEVQNQVLKNTSIAISSDRPYFKLNPKGTVRLEETSCWGKLTPCQKFAIISLTSGFRRAIALLSYRIYYLS